MANKIDTREIRQNIDKLEKKTKRAVDGIFELQAARSTAYMKTNAPWTDRTTAARSGIAATANNSAQSWEIIYAHAVKYGIWLEIIQHGRFSIILPSIRVAMHELTSLINGLWGKIK